MSITITGSNGVDVDLFFNTQIEKYTLGVRKEMDRLANEIKSNMQEALATGSKRSWGGPTKITGNLINSIKVEREITGKRKNGTILRYAIGTSLPYAKFVLNGQDNKFIIPTYADGKNVVINPNTGYDFVNIALDKTGNPRL
jgi:hypothetical protein